LIADLGEHPSPGVFYSLPFVDQLKDYALKQTRSKPRRYFIPEQSRFYMGFLTDEEIAKKATSFVAERDHSEPIMHGVAGERQPLDSE
jgi:hypothetical protein